MDEFEYLRKMHSRLEEMRRSYPREDGVISSAEAALIGSIRDYLAMRKPQGASHE